MFRRIQTRAKAKKEDKEKAEKLEKLRTCELVIYKSKADMLQHEGEVPMTSEEKFFQLLGNINAACTVPC